MNKKTKTLVAAAMAGLLAGITVPQAFANDHADAHTESGDKNSCKGDKASCHGKEGHGTPVPTPHDKNGCSGKDGCNGKAK